MSNSVPENDDHEYEFSLAEENEESYWSRMKDRYPEDEEVGAPKEKIEELTKEAKKDVNSLVEQKDAKKEDTTVGLTESELAALREKAKEAPPHEDDGFEFSLAEENEESYWSRMKDRDD